MRARYEGLADWYDNWLTDDDGEFTPFITAALDILTDLAGPGKGPALDVGCGTAIAAGTIRKLGWRPVGIDLSDDQLRHAARRMPVARANAARLPIESESVGLACTALTSTDLADFAGVAREAHRVLQPEGRWVLIAVHPCFYGVHAERLPDGTVQQHPAYRDSGFHASPPFRAGIQSRVGAWHRTLTEHIQPHLDAGFRLERVVEGGPEPLPGILGLTFSA